MRKKPKPILCDHTESKEELSYTRRTDDPMDGYKEIYLITCKKCNKQLDIITKEKEICNG